MFSGNSVESYIVSKELKRKGANFAFASYNASLAGHLKCIQAGRQINCDTSHLLPSVRVRACMIAFARGRRVCVCVCIHERALHEPLVCVRAVCVFSRACLRVDVSCACVIVACARSQSCVALTSRVRSR